MLCCRANKKLGTGELYLVFNMAKPPTAIFLADINWMEEKSFLVHIISIWVAKDEYKISFLGICRNNS